MSEGMLFTGRATGSEAASIGSMRGGCVSSAGAGVGVGTDTCGAVHALTCSAGGAVTGAGAVAACSAADAPVATAATGKGDDETASAGGAATAPSALAGKEVPHFGQNLARGLQTA